MRARARASKFLKLPEDTLAAPQLGSLSRQPTGLTPEIIRTDLVGHEASVRSVGLLYWFEAALVLAAGTWLMFGEQVTPPTSANLVPQHVVGGGLLGLGLVIFLTGVCLRRLDRKGRVPVALFSGIGLLAFPFGTLISAYIIYVIFGRKGEYVMSQEYREIVARTPHIKHKTSKGTWVLAGIILLVIQVGLCFLLWRRLTT